MGMSRRGCRDCPIASLDMHQSNFSDNRFDALGRALGPLGLLGALPTLRSLPLATIAVSGFPVRGTMPRSAHGLALLLGEVAVSVIVDLADATICVPIFFLPNCRDFTE